MRKYISLFFSAIIVLCACNDNTPDGVLEKEKMVNLLIDVHIADGSMFSISSQPDSAYKYGTGKYLAVFKNHGTDSAQFNKSLKYYASDPELMMTMYDTIAKRIQVKTDLVSKAMQKEQAEKTKKIDPSKMMRGKGMMPDVTIRSKENLLKAKLKADSIQKKKKLDSLKAKLKADSIRRKQKADSLRSGKRIKGKRI